MPLLIQRPTQRPMQRRVSTARSIALGVTLIELMVAMAISLFVMLGLVGLFVNTSRSNTELARTNNLLEDGRVSIQLLTEDLAHAGFWGGYLPQFDNLTYAGIPGDVPAAIPNPCLAYASWDAAYRTNAIGIAVQTDDALPAGAGCLSPLTKRAGTDVLISRHLDTCLPGTGSCEVDTAGELYFQAPLCEAEQGGAAQNGTFATITLASTASTTDDIYVGLTLSITGGMGGGQARVITAYDGATKVATIDPNWVTSPDNTTLYSLGYAFSTTASPMHKKNCTTTADKRKFVSNLYYVADRVVSGQTIPTLMRSQLGFVGAALAQQAPVALIEGIENFRVELGVDAIGKTGVAANYAAAITWADPNNKITPTNRGDGSPESFIRCTTADPCTPAELVNTVAVKLYVLVRGREPSSGYIDTKTYCLGEPNGDGTCPAASLIAAANDSYKRHVFTTSVRLVNVAGRRDTP